MHHAKVMLHLYCASCIGYQSDKGFISKFYSSHLRPGNRQFTCKELISLKKPGLYRLKSSSNGLLLQLLPSLQTRAYLNDRSNQVAAPNLWNALLHEIPSTFEINTLKHPLKTYLFSDAFYKILFIS